jgi:hypothetical protein
MKSLLDIIFEAQESAESIENSVAAMRSTLKAEKTKIPPAIATVKHHFLNSGEFELFEFLDNCEFWVCRSGAMPPAWFGTAGVRVNSKSMIEFYYDEDFIVKLAKKPGELAFLIAHEASHILRFHEDRQRSQGLDPSLYNTASDMIINRDIDKTAQIGGWKPLMPEGGMTVPKKFDEDFKNDKKAYYSENMYRWLLKNKKENPAQQEGPGQGEPHDYYGEGQIVRVNSGPHKGEYRKITKVNPDKTYDTEVVDINTEIEKVKASAFKKAAKAKGK